MKCFCCDKKMGIFQAGGHGYRIDELIKELNPIWFLKPHPNNVPQRGVGHIATSFGLIIWTDVMLCKECESKLKEAKNENR